MSYGLSDELIHAQNLASTRGELREKLVDQLQELMLEKGIPIPMMGNGTHVDVLLGCCIYLMGEDK